MSVVRGLPRYAGRMTNWQEEQFTWILGVESCANRRHFSDLPVNKGGMLTSELKGGAYIENTGGAMSRDITEVKTLVTAAGARAPDRRGPVDLQSKQPTLDRLR